MKIWIVKSRFSKSMRAFDSYKSAKACRLRKKAPIHWYIKRVEVEGDLQ